MKSTSVVRDRTRRPEAELLLLVPAALERLLTAAHFRLDRYSAGNHYRSVDARIPPLVVQLEAFHLACDPSRLDYYYQAKTRDAGMALDFPALVRRRWETPIK